MKIRHENRFHIHRYGSLNWLMFTFNLFRFVSTLTSDPIRRSDWHEQKSERICFNLMLSLILWPLTQHKIELKANTICLGNIVPLTTYESPAFGLEIVKRLYLDLRRKCYNLYTTNFNSVKVNEIVAFHFYFWIRIINTPEQLEIGQFKPIRKSCLCLTALSAHCWLD